MEKRRAKKYKESSLDTSKYSRNICTFQLPNPLIYFFSLISLSWVFVICNKKNSIYLLQSPNL